MGKDPGAGPSFGSFLFPNALGFPIAMGGILALA